MFHATGRLPHVCAHTLGAHRQHHTVKQSHHQSVGQSKPQGCAAHAGGRALQQRHTTAMAVAARAEQHLLLHGAANIHAPHHGLHCDTQLRTHTRHAHRQRRTACGDTRKRTRRQQANAASQPRACVERKPSLLPPALQCLWFAVTPARPRCADTRRQVGDDEVFVSRKGGAPACARRPAHNVRR